MKRILLFSSLFALFTLHAADMSGDFNTWLGYIAGITSKFLNEAYMANFSEKWYVLFFYVLNFCMVFADFLIYFRNKRLDQLAQ